MSVCPDLLKKMIAIARPFALHANAKSTERENKTWIPIFYDITLHEMPKLAQDKPERVIWVQNGGGGGGTQKYFCGHLLWTQFMIQKINN